MIIDDSKKGVAIDIRHVTDWEMLEKTIGARRLWGGGGGGGGATIGRRSDHLFPCFVNLNFYWLESESRRVHKLFAIQYHFCLFAIYICLEYRLVCRLLYILF